MDEIATLSKRGAENASVPGHWDPLVEALSNVYSPENPDGVMLGLAESSLMHDELEEHIKKNFEVDRSKHFTYGVGSQGSLRLRKAVSEYFNEYFHPLQPTKPDEFLATSGVSAMTDHLTWCLCDPGDGILCPAPLYTGFSNDVPTRARGKLIPASFAREDGSIHLDDVFDPEANLRCLERAYQKATQDGTKVRAVMITSPHNPLGKCYPVETIKAIASFCAKHNLHYLSDEIYAMTVFNNADNPQATPFTSVLSVDLDKIIRPELVHVLYSAAKDFCANGLRLGMFWSKNAALRKSMISISTFAWNAYIVQDMWSRILEDKIFLKSFVIENQKELTKHYRIITEFLKQYNISYYEGGNAAMFVWVDLRNWLLPGADSDNYKSLLSASPDSEQYRAKIDRLGKTCIKKGVTITNGVKCHTEELGWFRVVFTAKEEVLKIGLQRFIDGLHEWKRTEES